MSDYRERLVRVLTTLQDSLTVTQHPDARLRTQGKIEGVDLALSYYDQMAGQVVAAEAEDELVIAIRALGEVCRAVQVQQAHLYDARRRNLERLATDTR